MEGNYNPFSFLSSDIVVWNGIISSYGAIAHLTSEDDELRTATEEEKIAYKNAP